MITAYVTTCPQRKMYRETTVNNLKDAGFKDVCLVTDGPFFELPQLGIKSTFKRALHTGIIHDGPFCVFQDDVLVSKGLHDYLTDLRLTGVVSLYTSEHVAVNWHQSKGWINMNTEMETQETKTTHGFGACGYYFPEPGVAQKYLERDPQMQKNYAVGSSILEFCKIHCIPHWNHLPSLIQHIGEETALHGFVPNNEYRRASLFCDDVARLTREQKFYNDVAKLTGKQNATNERTD